MMTGAERATTGRATPGPWYPSKSPCGHYNPSLVGDWCANCAWTRPAHQDLVEIATDR